MPFLDGIGQGIGSAIAGPIVSGLFGPQDRISHERFVENETRMDWHNENNIGRESAFLAGVTPARADAYNQYQDATYASDTARQAGRIQTLGQELGMSPWELAGQQGAGPATVMPGPSGSGNSAQNYMASLVPLKTAELQSKTALAQTAMQTQTSKEIASMQTDDGNVAREQTKVMRGVAALNQAQTDQTKALTIQAALDFIYNKSPEMELKTPVGSMKYRLYVDQVLEAYKNSKQENTAKGGITQSDSTNEAIIGAINKVPKDEQEAFFKAMRNTLNQALDQGSDAISDTIQKGGNFLAETIFGKDYKEKLPKVENQSHRRPNYLPQQ